MLIKCENCGITYEVSEKKLIEERPKKFKCSSCGLIFDAPILEELPDIIPPLEQKLEPKKEPEQLPIKKDELHLAQPMPLADIFKPEEETPIKNITEEESSFEKEIDKNSSSLFSPIDEEDVFTPVEAAPKNRHFIGGIVAFLLTLFLLILLVYVGRYYFIRQLPSTESIYQKIGISTDVLGSGLSFQDTVFNIENKGKQYILLVNSKVKNITAEEKNVPVIQLTVLDAFSKKLHTDFIRLPIQKIAPGEEMDFQSVIKPLSLKARKVEITFKREIK